ncbi:MAG: hypothetical protein IJ557_02440 [Bacteroidaceae bacterium]|nr:hypothetical protein [Bacteroidaceae bacterium]
MTNLTNIIEPCCIQNQLPRLLNHYGSGYFYSNGDWGTQKLLFSVSMLIPDPAVTVLLMPSVDVGFCRYLLQCLQRHWMQALCLCTADDCTDMVNTELAGYADKVLYAVRPNLRVGLYVRYNHFDVLAISGPMGVDNEHLFCQYSYITQCAINSDTVHQLLSPTVSLFVSAAKEQQRAYSPDIKNFLERKWHIIQ